jgi:hypothetical protein
MRGELTSDDRSVRVLRSIGLTKRIQSSRAQIGGSLRGEVEAPLVCGDRGSGLEVLGSGASGDGHFDPLHVCWKGGGLAMMAMPGGDRTLEGKEQAGGSGEGEPKRPTPTREGSGLTYPGGSPPEVRLRGRFR